MELELGFKLTKVIDDLTTASDLLLSKDRGGPLFISRETDTMFILTAHLKGYKRINIKIEINKDGTLLAISGEKPVQETVRVVSKVYKEEVQMRGFRKAFKIPIGVVLDKVKAKFNEEESTLTISIPKVAKGMFGYELKEVKEEEIPRGDTQSMQIVVDETREIQGSDKAEETFEGKSEMESGREIEELAPKKVEENLKKEIQEIGTKDAVEKTDDHPTNRFPLMVWKLGGKERESEETRHAIEEEMETNQDQKVNGEKETNGMENDNQEEEEMRGQEEENVGSGGKEEEKAKPKKTKLCGPLFAGSAILVSLIVLVIHLIRTKNQTSNEKAKKKKQ